jgi:hypothetical protein
MYPVTRLTEEVLIWRNVNTSYKFIYGHLKARRIIIRAVLRFPVAGRRDWPFHLSVRQVTLSSYAVSDLKAVLENWTKLE